MNGNERHQLSRIINKQNSEPADDKNKLLHSIKIIADNSSNYISSLSESDWRGEKPLSD